MSFVSYRVVHRIHLGGLEQVLEVDSIVQFNGRSLKTEDGTEINLAQPSAIAGAIKVGWLVPVDSSQTTFRPKSAGIQVHSAKSSGEKRQAVEVMTVHDEEQNLGDRKEVRKSSGGSKQASANPNPAEGVVVSRLKTPAKALPVEMGKDDRAALQVLENKPLEVEKFKLKQPSGDVAEALSGEELEDILPEAATARPPKKAYSNDGVVTSSGGNSSVGGQEDGVVISKVGAPRPQPPQRLSAPVYMEDEEETLLPEDPTFREKALRRWAQTGKTWNGQPPSLKDLSLMALTVLDLLEAARKTSPKKSPQVPQAPQVPQVPQVAVLPETSLEEGGGFSWDLSLHWKTRKAALQNHLSDPEALRKIYAMENSGGVKKAIEEHLGEIPV